MGNPEERSGYFIYLAVFTTSLATFVTGCCFAWTSPLLPKFQSENNEDLNPIGYPVTLSESAWIVSAMILGLVFGPPVSVISSKYFTKKTVLLISIGPILVAHIICSFAAQVSLFIMARLLMGIGTGAVWAVLGTYVAEISEDANRGILGCIPGIMSTFGYLYVYIIGPYFDMKLLGICIIIPIILFYIGFGMFIPDSPYDLLIKNNTIKAENSLIMLRQMKNVEKELTYMKETVLFGSNDEVRLGDLLKDLGLRKGLKICVALMVFQQLSGNVAVVSYAETIFKLGTDFIPSHFCPMILGVAGVLGNLVSLFIIDKMGRKILLTASCILESISLFVLGLYFYLLNSGVDVSAISWAPIASLIVFTVAFNLALGIVPWIVTGELFQSNMKPLASTLTALSNFSLSFVISMCFPYMVEYISIEWTFWIFDIFMVLGTVFCIVILPETKGKNFQEIQKILTK